MTEDVVGREPTAEERRAFLAERRRIATERFDERFAPTYDADWGAVAPSHAAMLERMLARTRAGGVVLDAACGTGKYWPAILASGRRVEGIDQSAGMLAQAARQAPDVPTRRLALQALEDQAAYDAVICMDAMEYVGPEDWPSVVRRLRDAARPGAPVYLTVELFDATEDDADGLDLQGSMIAARARGEPVVLGEHLNESGGYHYYPVPEQAVAWVEAAGLVVDSTLIGDAYLHLLAHRPG